MTVSFVGAQGAAAATVTIPAHQSGDLILLFAYRDGSNTAPTTPTAGGTVPTWNSIGSSGGNTNSSSFAWARATASTTTSGTWTNATELICLVYRGASVGASIGGSGNATTTINYPALTLNRTNNTSWVVGVAGHRTATNVEVAPTGMTNRASSGTEAAGHDTNGTVSSWSSTNVTVDASSAYRSWVVELRDRSLTDNATVGTFTLTGQPNTLARGRVMTGDRGSFTLTGQPADTRHNAKIDGGTGALALTGNPAATTVGRTLAGDLGKFFLPERNLIARSEEIDQWTGATSNTTVSANAAIAPDGTATADKVVVANASNVVVRRSAQLPAFRKGQSYVISCYVKAAGLSTVAVFFDGTYVTTDYYGSGFWLNLSTGVASNPGLNVQNVGNGWYRVWLVQTADNDGIAPTGGHRLSVAPGSTGNVNSVTGNGVDGVFVWGGQFEEGTTPSTYDPTGPAAATDAALRQQYKLDGGTGAFALTGNNATLAKSAAPNKTLTVDAGAFSLTGNQAAVRRGYALAVDAGTFAATGQPATLRHNPRIEANTGSFALTGGAPALLRGRYLSGGAGEFIETGQPATFRRTWAVQAATGSFALTGNPASLTEVGAYELLPLAGAFTLSGGSPSLAQSQTMPVDAGAFVFTGQLAALRQGYRLDAGTGAFSFTGQPATLAKQSARQLAADAGILALAGQQATLIVDRKIAADRGLFTLTGQPAALRLNPALVAQIGSFSFAGQSATLQVNRLLSLQSGTFIFTGNSANLADTDELYPALGAFALVGLPASLVRTSTARRRNVLIF